MFENLKQDVQRWGTGRALYSRVMLRLRPWLFVSHIFVRPLKAASGEPEPDEIRIRLATREELLRTAQEIPDQLSTAFVEAACARGDQCIAAFDGPKIVTYIWRSFSTAPHGDGLWVAFEKPYRYAYKAYTRPEYRGRHIMPRVSLASDAMCREMGYTHGLSFIETHNYPSLATGKYLGQVPIGYAGYLKLGRRVYPFRTPGVRRHSFRFFHPAAE